MMLKALIEKADLLIHQIQICLQVFFSAKFWILMIPYEMRFIRLKIVVQV
jgi:hypothetical protein